MTVQQCKYILKIAECGSFNEAAKQLFVAQSSLSVSIKSLENELNIKIFERSGSGVFLTDEGMEFVRYARQLSEQSDFILNRYKEPCLQKQFYVATQHYDFVVDVFGKLLDLTTDNYYRFSLREMKTHDVINETEKAYCDIGILAVKASDFSFMERYFNKKNLVFTELLKAMPHIYIRKEHVLSCCSVISLKDLADFPYVFYEQGKHSNSFFAEEIIGVFGNKQVEISDRASLMNVLLATDCYTVGTGIMPSMLNADRILSIPFQSDDYYIIGYIIREDKKMSDITKSFIKLLRKSASEYQNRI